MYHRCKIVTTALRYSGVVCGGAQRPIRVSLLLEAEQLGQARLVLVHVFDRANEYALVVRAHKGSVKEVPSDALCDVLQRVGHQRARDLAIVSRGVDGLSKVVGAVKVEQLLLKRHGVRVSGLRLRCNLLRRRAVRPEAAGPARIRIGRHGRVDYRKLPVVSREKAGDWVAHPDHKVLGARLVRLGVHAIHVVLEVPQRGGTNKLILDRVEPRAYGGAAALANVHKPQLVFRRPRRSWRHKWGRWMAEALEPFLTDDEALSIGIIRGAACNHSFVTAHAGPRTARVAAVVVGGPLPTVHPTTSVALGCLGNSEGRVQLLESAPVVRYRVFELRG